MLKRLLEREIDAELLATFIFMAISGCYIIITYGFLKLEDALLLWMFPASVMVFLTLLIVKVIEMIYRKKTDRSRYIPIG
jgi:hypothetical protein